MGKSIDSLLTEILPIIDNFDRERDFVNRNHKNLDNKLLDVHLRYQNYMKSLAHIFKKYSLVKIKNPTGEKFNPYFHNAVFTKCEPNKEEDIVLELLSNGYRKGSKVLKYCDVVVNKKNK